MSQWNIVEVEWDLVCLLNKDLVLKDPIPKWDSHHKDPIPKWVFLHKDLILQWVSHHKDHILNNLTPLKDILLNNLTHQWDTLPKDPMGRKDFLLDINE